MEFFPELTPSPKLTMNMIKNPPSSPRLNKSKDIKNPIKYLLK